MATIGTTVALAACAAPMQGDPLLDEITRKVNREIVWREDTGRDYVTGRSFGDCRAFAIETMKILSAHGIGSYLGVYYEPRYKRMHAVVIMGDSILDAVTNELRPVSSVKKWYWIGRESFGRIYPVAIGTWQGLRRVVDEPATADVK